MSDERTDRATPGDALLAAVFQLPRGSGVVFRHYGLGPGERRALFATVRRHCTARRLLLFLADRPERARAWRADGVHLSENQSYIFAAVGRARRAGLLVSRSVHHQKQLLEADRTADLIFLSPVYATASHPGAVPLGVERFARLARLARRPVIALGGMDPGRFETMKRYGAYGWAAIDALTPTL